MLERRLSLALRRAGEPRATGIFVVTAAAVAALVAFVPHTPRTPHNPNAVVGMNAMLSTNFAMLRTYVRPQRAPGSYGIMGHRLTLGAGGGVLASSWVRPTGAPGGRACLALVAVTGGSSVPAQSEHECVPLVAGWSRFPAVRLRAAASGYVYPEITAYGNDGGFEARPLKVARVAS